MLQPALVALFVSIQYTAGQIYDADLQISLSVPRRHIKAGGARSSPIISSPFSLSLSLARIHSLGLDSNFFFRSGYVLL